MFVNYAVSVILSGVYGVEESQRFTDGLYAISQDSSTSSGVTEWYEPKVQMTVKILADANNIQPPFCTTHRKIIEDNGLLFGRITLPLAAK